MLLHMSMQVRTGGFKKLRHATVLLQKFLLPNDSLMVAAQQHCSKVAQRLRILRYLETDEFWKLESFCNVREGFKTPVMKFTNSVTEFLKGKVALKIGPKQCFRGF